MKYDPKVRWIFDIRTGKTLEKVRNCWGVKKD